MTGSVTIALASIRVLIRFISKLPDDVLTTLGWLAAARGAKVADHGPDGQAGETRTAPG